MRIIKISKLVLVVIVFFLFSILAPKKVSCQMNDSLFVEFKDYYLSVKAQNKDINDVFKEISAKTGVKIFSDSRIESSISIDFKKKGFTRGMKLILNQLGPDEYKGKLNLGKTFSGSIYKIRRVTEKEIREKERKAESLNAQGEKLLKEGKDYQAFHLFIKALISDKNYLPAHKNLVRVYDLWEDHEKLIERLGNVIDLDSDDAENYRMLADAYRKTYRHEKAMENYAKFIAKRSKKEEIAKAKAIMVQMNTRKTKQYFEKVSKARDLIGKGKINDAMAALNQAIDIDPSITGAYEYMAMLHEMGRDYETAIEWRKKLLDMTPDVPKNLLFLGRDLRMLSNNQAALEYLTRAGNVSKSEYMDMLIAKELKNFN